MTIEERKSFQAREYAEAIRYMDNAEDILKKANKSGLQYVDRKYVRSACGTAYCGVLVALDAWLTLKGVDVPNPEKKKKDGQRKKMIGFYHSNIAKLDKKMLDHLDDVYSALHLSGYYDGVKNVKVIRGGFEEAYWIIDRIKPTATTAS